MVSVTSFNKLAIPIMLSTLISLMLLLGVQQWFSIQDNKHSHAEFEQIRAKVEVVADHLSHALNQRLYHTRSLAALVKSNLDVTQNEFTNFVELLEANQAGVRSLQLAPGGIVTFVTNIEANRKALGHDLFADQKRRHLVEKSVEDRVYTIAGPINLIQGGTAIIARRPIFTSEPDQTEDEFWGFATILIDVEPLLREVGYFNFQKNISLAIRGKDARGPDGDIFMGREEVFDNAKVVADVPLVSGSWQLGATWSSLHPHPIPPSQIVAWLMAILFSLFLGVTCFAIIRQPQVLQEAVDQATVDLSKAKFEADQANKAKSEFLAHMSHELRTPLNAISGFSQIMAKETFGEHGHPKYLEYAQDILFSGQHLLSLINDILDLSKIEAGEFTISPTRFSLHHAIDDCINLIKVQGSSHPGRIGADKSDKITNLYADNRIFRQILLNLLSNADKFTPVGGCIRVTSKFDDDNNIVIQVTDTGSGIAPENLATVLEPFGQARSNTLVSHKGTGLGLPLSQKLMELHGGTLELQSEMGIGTTVTITFPAGGMMIDN